MKISLPLILSLVSAARAANDWNTPCLSGVCSYDLPSTNGSASSGNMKIWGSNTAIGDITEAAGWKILNCSPDVLTQDIRLVCMGETSMCQHLFSGHGAVDTIVRLSEDCGKGPFARVQKSWIPADQSMPADIAARIVRRDGSRPQVQALTLDTNFTAVDSSKTGTVNLAIMAMNVPGMNDVLDTNTTSSASQRRSRLNKRQSTVSSAVHAVASAVSSANNVNINKSKALPAADFSKQVSLFETSLSCPPINAEASVNLDATAHAVVTVGVAASGTIVPPEITSFSLSASLTADLTGKMVLKAELSGTLDSGNKLLFQTGIPGLDFPGILSLGPTFQVNARGTATAEVAADLTIGINYHVNNAQMTFPSGSGSGGDFSLGDTPLTLSADTSVEATTTIEAHLIPSINFGLSALDVATANVALSLDASASMVLKVEGKAGASATVQQADRKKRQDDDGDDGDDGGDSDSTDDSSDGLDSTATTDDSTTDADDGTSDDTDDQTDSDSDDSTDTTDPTVDDGAEDTNGDDDTAHDDSADQDTDSADSTDDSTDGVDDSSDADSSDSDDDINSGTNSTSTDTSLDGDDDGLNSGTNSTSTDTDSLDGDDDDSGLNSATNSTSTDTDQDGLDDANNSTSIDTGDGSDNSTASATTTTTSASTATSATSTTSAAPLASVTTAANASFGGSFTINGGLDLSASATGSFFGLFDSSKKLSLFQKTFPLFSQTFGDEGGEGSEGDSGSDAASDSGNSDSDSTDSASDSTDDSDDDDADSADDNRRSLSARRTPARAARRTRRFAFQRRGLTCTSGKGETKELADTTVPGQSL